MSWEKILKFGDGKFMFILNAKVTTKNEDNDEVDMDERSLHGLAQDVLQELLGKTFSQEFDDDDGSEFTVTCEITSVSEHR